METCMSDFTNTFRDLSLLSKDADMTESDQAALQALCKKNTAPKDGFLNDKISVFEKDAQIMQILEKAPQMLKMLGLDPNRVHADIARVKKERDEIEENYEGMVEGFKDPWVQWITKYKQILSKQKQTDEERREKMNRANPAFILRNYLMDEAITKAEQKADFSMVE